MPQIPAHNFQTIQYFVTPFFQQLSNCESIQTIMQFSFNSTQAEAQEDYGYGESDVDYGYGDTKAKSVSRSPPSRWSSGRKPRRCSLDESLHSMQERRSYDYGKIDNNTDNDTATTFSGSTNVSSGSESSVDYGYGDTKAKSDSRSPPSRSSSGRNPADAVLMQVFTACKSDDLTTMARLTTPLQCFPVPQRSAMNLMSTTATTAARPRPTLSPAPLLPDRAQDVSPADAASIRAFNLAIMVCLTIRPTMTPPRLFPVSG